MLPIMGYMVRLWITFNLFLCSIEVSLKSSCNGLLDVYSTCFLITGMLNNYNLSTGSLYKAEPPRKQLIDQIIVFPAIKVGRVQLCIYSHAFLPGEPTV